MQYSSFGSVGVCGGVGPKCLPVRQRLRHVQTSAFGSADRIAA